MKYKVDIVMLRLSIKNACDELFHDHEMKGRAYRIISSNVEDDVMEYGEKCDDN